MNRQQRMVKEYKKFLDHMQKKGFDLGDLAALQLGASVAYLQHAGMTAEDIKALIDAGEAGRDYTFHPVKH